jgi:formate-dependent nitrite reductase membrane component NrfD
VIAWESLAGFAKSATAGNEALPAWLDAVAPALALYSMVPGVIAASLAIVIVSKLGRPPSDAVQFTHKGVMETLKVHGY